MAELTAPPEPLATTPPAARADAARAWLRRAGDRRALLALGLPLAFALAARAPYFAGSDFPLNDGGLFVAMARDLLAARFALPDVTSYNAEGVPFAYPPAAFYLVALLTRVLGLDPIALARYLPLAANLGSVLVASALARSLVGGWTAVLGVVIFALIPRSYEWLIMGGGLTRSFGLLFALGCLTLAVPLFRRPTLGRAVACAVLAALAVATHLEFGLFVAYSLGLLAVCHGRGPRSLALTALVGAAGVALAAPWWGTVLARHGLAPFSAASHTGEWTSLPGQLQALEDFLTPPRLLLALPGGLMLLGVAACLLRGRLFLVLWLLAIFVLNPRSAPTEASLPVGLLAAAGVADVVWPGLQAAGARARSAGRERGWLWAAWGRVVRAVGGGRAVARAGLVVALVGVYLSWPSLHPNRHALDVLSTDDRRAMRWVADSSPPDDAYLVLTRGWTWEDDHVSEWFPVLAERRSVLTVQATEWLPEDAFVRARCLYNQARELGALQWSVDRLDQWASDRNVVFSSVYVSASVQGPLDWRPLVASARESPNYSVAYDAADVVILRRQQPIQPRWAASGPLLIADDCTSLSEQPEDVQRAWEQTSGSLAGRAWVDDHDRALRGGQTPLDRLSHFLFGTGTGHS